MLPDHFVTLKAGISTISTTTIITERDYRLPPHLYCGALSRRLGTFPSTGSRVRGELHMTSITRTRQKHLMAVVGRLVIISQRNPPHIIIITSNYWWHLSHSHVASHFPPTIYRPVQHAPYSDHHTYRPYLSLPGRSEGCRASLG